MFQPGSLNFIWFIVDKQDVKFTFRVVNNNWYYYYYFVLLQIDIIFLPSLVSTVKLQDY